MREQEKNTTISLLLAWLRHDRVPFMTCVRHEGRIFGKSEPERTKCTASLTAIRVTRSSPLGHRDQRMQREDNAKAKKITFVN